MRLRELRAKVKRAPLSSKLCGWLLALSILLCSVAGCADSLFYFPTATEYTGRTEQTFEVEEVYFTSADGTKLHGWFCKAEGKARGAIFHLHGAAGNLTHHIALVRWLPQNGYHLFVWDYRGYGKSEGTPTKSGVKADTRAALAVFLARPEVKNLPRAAYGQSLGTAYASMIAAEEPTAFDAVMLGAPFTSHRDIAVSMMQRYPVLYPLSHPLAWLLVSSGPDSAELVKDIHVPLLVTHGRQDSIVPFHMGKEVFDAANEPRVWLPYDAGHISESQNVRAELLQFLDEHLGKAKEKIN